MVSYNDEDEPTSDPFSEEELDTGRVPKVVDDWLVEQIRKGKDTDEIRAMLSIPDVAKQEVGLVFFRLKSC